MRRLLVFALVPLLLGCSGPTGTPDTTAPKTEGERRRLPVVLFGYIPNAGDDAFAGLSSRLEADFEQQHPEIDLEITIDVNLDLYDLADDGQLAKLFGEGPEAASVVEIDTVLLADVVAKGWLAPARVDVPDIVATAWDAATIDDTRYGVPTYLCSNFVYSWAPVQDATDAKSLLEILRAADPEQPPLIGNYAGSWTLPAYYLDAWADGHTNDPAAVAGAYELPLDEPTMVPLEDVIDACENSGANPCLDGTYKYNTKSEQAFAKGEANGFIGYSERLFYVLDTDSSRGLPNVSSAPIGMGSKPTLFVDALVTSAKCQDTCRDDADLFIEFMSTLEVRQLIAFSQDAPGKPPRYLLQARSSFYTSEPAASDPIYQALQPIATELGRALPNSGFPAAREDLDAALVDALTKPAK